MPLLLAVLLAGLEAPTIIEFAFEEGNIRFKRARLTFASTNAAVRAMQLHNKRLPAFGKGTTEVRLTLL